MGRDQDRCAVVLGASMAGLLAARVLAERFATVVVVERDQLPVTTQHRRGVPQGKQIHALLAGGQRAFEELLPGLTADLAADGAPVGDALADMRLCFGGHWFRRALSGLTLVHASRALLEHHVRSRVRCLPEVTVVDRCDVVGVAGSRGRLDGVRVLRHADNSVEEMLDADLVVDATGRGSRAPVWLSELGCDAPAEERIAVDLGYATRCYRLAADALHEDLGILLAPTPSRPRGLALARLEDDIWMLTLAGVQGDHPPTTVPGFNQFATSVGPSEIATVLHEGEPVDAPIAFRFPASRRRRYERLPLPINLVVMGDSLCNFNPVYGQGMSVAALEARALQRHIAAEVVPSSRRVMGAFARIVDVPWQMTAAADRAFLPTAGSRDPRERLMARYVDRVQAGAARHATLGRAFLRVAGLVDSPLELLKPGVALRALLPVNGK